jgi:hypothetical protein
MVNVSCGCNWSNSITVSSVFVMNYILSVCHLHIESNPGCDVYLKFIWFCYVPCPVYIYYSQNAEVGASIARLSLCLYQKQC